MAKTGIYRIRNVNTGRVYVGQSSDIYQRWRQHRHFLSTGTHANRYLQNSWKKHGSGAFEFEIVKECLVSDLHREEQAALNDVPEKKRYNLGPAGVSPTLGVVRTDSHRKNASRSRGGRPIIAKNIATGVERRFEHAGLLEEIGEGFSADTARAVARGIGKTHNGHTFRWDPLVPAQRREPQRQVGEKRNRAVIGTHLVTSEEVRFASVSSVENAGFKRTGVAKCLQGEMESHPRGEYRWRYADGLPHKAMEEEKRKKLEGFRRRGNSREVIGTDSAGHDHRYPYIAAAAKSLGIDPSYIHLCLSGKLKKAALMTWRRV